MKRLIISLIISLNIITAQKPYNEQPQEIDPTVLNGSNFQYLNTIRTQRDDWFELSTLSQVWDGSDWVNDYQISNTYDANNNHTSYLQQDWDGTQWVNDRLHTYTYDANNNQTGYLRQGWDGQWVNDRLYTYTYDAKDYFSKKAESLSKNKVLIQA